MKLELTTGNVTSTSKEIANLSVECGRPPAMVRLCLSGMCGEIEYDDWPLLLGQVTENALLDRPQLEPPLGLLRGVTGKISSTPTFQLFLAGLDLAERIELVSGASYEHVKRRFKGLNRWMPSITGAGGLFFLPDDLIKGIVPGILQELLKNNKLCQASLGDCETVGRFYVPYATPIGFVAGPVSGAAGELWSKINSLCYESRQTA